jgi:hypothetical protein
LLAGALLVRQSRQEVLRKLGDGLDDDIQRVVDSMRDGRLGAYRAWLKSRGVEVADDAIIAISDALAGEKAMDEMQTQISELRYAKLLENPDEFRTRLQRIIDGLGQWKRLG